jgi:hypothetical protein
MLLAVTVLPNDVGLVCNVGNPDTDTVLLQEDRPWTRWPELHDAAVFAFGIPSIPNDFVVNGRFTVLGAG